MQSRALACVIAMASFAVLAIPLGLGAQEEPGATRLSSLPWEAQSRIYAAMGGLPGLQVAKLTASDGAPKDELNISVAISGNTVVAGAPLPLALTGPPGAAYVFVKPASGWKDLTETAKLTPRAGETVFQFGTAVAIDGDTVVVGATDYNTPASGAAYVFVKPASGWANMTQTARLIAADGAAGDSLGYSVGVSGNTVVAGAWDASLSGTNQFEGAAYVFVKPASGWTNMNNTAKLTASDAAFGQELGWSVSVSGNTVVAGTPNAQPGAAYVFVKPQTGWATMNENQKLTPLDGAAVDLGYSVSIDGTTTVAGAPAATVGSNELQGAAYVFGSSPVSLSPESLGFGAREAGTNSGAQSTLTNTGQTALTIASIQVTGSGAADYAQTNNCPTTLASGGTCTLSVTFSPTQLGPEIASVTITDNDGGNPHSVALSGVGVTLGGNATLSPTSLTFATQLVGTAGPTQFATLANYGTVPLSITRITASADFGESNTCGSSLAVGASCRINTDFAPTGSGTRTGTLSIADNAPNSPQTVSLTGTGTVVEFNPTSLSFSCRYVNRGWDCPPPQNTILTNTGSTTLSISGITITGSTDFTETNTCGTSLAAGQSCTISVTFNNHGKSGTFSGSVSISDNGGGSPQTVPLTGTAFRFAGQ